MISTSVAIKVQFYDLDPMGIVWHGNYPRFLEQARSALFEKISFGYRAMAESGYAWPNSSGKLAPKCGVSFLPASRTIWNFRETGVHPCVSACDR